MQSAGGAAEVYGLALRWARQRTRTGASSSGSRRARPTSRARRPRGPASVLVRGPEAIRPEGAVVLPQPRREARPITLSEPIDKLDVEGEARAALAARALARTVAALGGKDALAPEGKARRQARVRVASSLPYREEWTVDLATGAAERRRTILATVIRDFEEGGKVVEEVEGERRELGEGEAGLFRLEALCDPRVLLTTVLRDGLRPELAGRIRAGGRDHLALDLTVAGQVLRLVVDEHNGLPRRLEYDEWQPGRPAQRVTLLFEAYDQRGGLVGPSRVARYVEGEFRAELSY
ncbi:MAG: hypothetical protein R3F30_07680 [Planctomycetota bacterium]